MKTLSMILLALLLHQDAQSKNSSTASLLPPYLGIKEALVYGNAKQAASYAQTLIDSMAGIAPNILGNTPANELRQSAKIIASNTDIEKQRSAFAELSKVLWAVLKSSGYDGDTLYYDYCPMKKSYWISKEANIRNPYYGNKMLTCGNIHEKR